MLQADVWSLGITAIEMAKVSWAQEAWRDLFSFFFGQGKPPLHGIPPLRALFLIPKPDHRPDLGDGEFSKARIEREEQRKTDLFFSLGVSRVCGSVSGEGSGFAAVGEGEDPSLHEKKKRHSFVFG